MAATPGCSPVGAAVSIGKGARSATVGPDFAAIFDYEAQPKEYVAGCNLCGMGPVNGGINRRDRYGYAVGFVACQCGLVYLYPRMTPEAYARFYRDGTYRKLVSAFHGREINAQTIQPEQLVYAAELAEFIGPYVGQAKTLLDVGGSTGVVAGDLAGRFELKATVLDPAPDELAQATGLETIQASVEDWEPNGRTWDVITLCQTVDHLLDIAGTLRKLKAALAPGGVFFVDALDYARGQVVKIDHPHNFTLGTLLHALQRAGFGLVAFGVEPTHVRVIGV
jgi:SAM-dependent methyltransferase